MLFANRFRMTVNVFVFTAALPLILPTGVARAVPVAPMPDKNSSCSCCARSPAHEQESEPLLAAVMLTTSRWQRALPRVLTVAVRSVGSLFSMFPNRPAIEEL